VLERGMHPLDAVDVRGTGREVDEEQRHPAMGPRALGAVLSGHHPTVGPGSAGRTGRIPGTGTGPVRRL
jgi:hypothetical protein